MGCDRNAEELLELAKQYREQRETDMARGHYWHIVANTIMSIEWFVGKGIIKEANEEARDLCDYIELTKRFPHFLKGELENTTEERDGAFPDIMGQWNKRIGVSPNRFYIEESTKRLELSR
ncbi:MAG: hypothetical protein ABIG28_02985 [archaeon]